MIQDLRKVRTYFWGRLIEKNIFLFPFHKHKKLSFLRELHGVIVVYDITDPDSYNDVKLWLDGMDEYNNFS